MDGLTLQSLLFLYIVTKLVYIIQNSLVGAYKISLQLYCVLSFSSSMIITILCLVCGAITFGNRSGTISLQSISEIQFRSCMLYSGKRYQPVSEISEVTDLLKIQMEETSKQELRHKEEQHRYAQLAISLKIFTDLCLEMEGCGS